METLSPDATPLWTEFNVEYWWRGIVLRMQPRVPREHFEPIEDEV